MRTSIISLLTALILLVQVKAIAQYPTDYTFESYKIKEGLSEGGTYSVFQDHLGYIWVGTIGLERFDGYTFKNYRSSVFDSAAIASGQKRVIKEDAQQNLWVCTEQTISKLHRATDTWKNFENKKITDRLSDISFEKGTNLVYVTTYNDGLWSLDPTTNTWKQYPYTLKSFRKVVEISDQELLISTNNGLVVFNKKSKTFGATYLQSTNPNNVIKFNIFTQKDATHWYVSSSNGIYLFSKKEGLTPAFQTIKGNDNSIMDSTVTAIHYDPTKQELWAKIAKKGLDIIHLKSNTITHLNNENYPDANFIKNSIAQIIQDRQNNIWLSTYDGIFKYNPTKKEIKTISDKEPYELKLPFTKTWGAYIGPDKHLWVAGSDHADDGIYEIDLVTKKSIKYAPKTNDKLGNAWIITEDANKNIWAFNTKLSINAGFEIFKKDQKEKTFKWLGNTNNLVKAQFDNSFGQSYITENRNYIFGGTPAILLIDSNSNLVGTPYAPLSSLNKERIYSFFHASKGRTYILTQKRLLLWNEDQNTFKTLTSPKINFKDFAYRSIFSMFNLVVYKDSIAYVAGYDYGLAVIDLKKQTQKVFTVNDGLPTQLIYDLKMDPGNNLWMSTDFGLVRYSILKNQFKNLTPSEGAQGYEYNSWANFSTKDGDFIYSGQGGINYFNYKDVTDNEQKPTVIIQRVTVKNKLIPIESISHDEPIVVKYNENILAFDFVAFNYKNTLQNKYKYKMEGYENDWRESGSRHFTTYTNLPAGEYTFRVIACNNDGLWNEEGASVKIKILPAPWFTWWAFMIYVVFVLFGIYKFIQFKQVQQKKHLEDERKNNELAEAKALQERLLPKTNPQINHLDIATYLRTSTEVGGDYYDFFEQADGSLYAICGDATGHGTPSGMLVSITKAGIIGLPQMAPNKMLTALNKVVKKVDLGILRMSLNIALIKGNDLTLSSAGMPPYFIYRAENKNTEEILLSGVPLGSFNEVSFDEKTTTFKSGDILAIISDGLAEAPNAKGDLFDYANIQSIITEHSHMNAQTLIDELMSQADIWLAGAHNPDDITIVIIKHK
jgi:ligand-binding sensor domain-containing protein